MSETNRIRRAALKIMYLYTAAGAGALGLVMILAPEWLVARCGIPVQDPVVFSIAGSLYAAFGGISLLGLRYPVRMAPILLLQMSYKIIWIIVILLYPPAPAWPEYAVFLMAAAFLSYIIGDIYAIPFREVFKREKSD